MSPDHTPPPRTFTKQELLDNARSWMLRECGRPCEMSTDEERDRYHARLGLLAHFIQDLFDTP